MGIKGILRDFGGFYGILRIFKDILRDFERFSGIPRDSYGFYGMLRSFKTFQKIIIDSNGL